jgi:bacillithiol synthase
MQSTCVRNTELPHTAKLFTDYLYHFDRVARFYAHNPYDPASFRKAAADIQLPPDRRSQLASALREQNGPSAALDHLAREGTVAVVTGQQVGLFSGPCYTIYKALTAARLAGTLTESGIPAVPVFWLATEDHDLEEVNHCWVFNSVNQPVKLEIPDGNSGRRPVGEIVPDHVPIDELRHALAGFPFAEETVAMVADAYAPGVTLGAAFATLLKRILARLGLLFIDPMHPASRRLAAPLLADAVRKAPELKRSLLDRNQELTAAGYHVQVHVEAETSFVFLLEDGQRLPLRKDGSDYITNGRRLSPEDLAQRAESLSPNALLRPVVQDSMLPTVAYVGGPAELAYLAQSEVIYRALLGRMPVAVSRQSATLLDGRASRLMDRYELVLPDFFHGEDAVREKMARKLVPPELGRTLGDARLKAGEVLDRVERALAAFEPTQADAFKKSRRRVEYQFAKIERKAAREALRRDQRASSDAAYLCGLVFPEKHLQERLYSIVPFLARHGTGLIDMLADGLTLECRDHRVVVA